MSDFVEAVLDAVRDVLVTVDETAEDLGGTVLTTKIREINTEKGDELLDIIMPDYIYVGKRTLQTVLHGKVPAIVIFPEDSPGVEPDNDSLDCNHQILVMVIDQYQNEVGLQQRLWRYLRAVTEVLFETWTLSNTVDKVDFLGHSYDLEEYDEENKVFLNTAAVRLRINNEVGLS